LREVLAARSDRDFVVASPSRRSAAAPSTSVWERALRAVLTHPKEAFAAVVLAGSATAIIVNALAFQSVRHLTPVFGERAQTRAEAPAPLPPARPVAPAPLALVPQPRNAVRDVASDATRTGEVPPPAPARTILPASPARSAAPRDPIGDLIRSSEAPTPSGPVSRTDPQHIVAAGQRALAKLGYGPLKPDGIMGPGTRQAIERFERDRRLAVTGELGPRTARELAALSGIPIE
jgi:Putative peptidoglycan binding domain